MSLQTVTRLLPSYWASYLINADASGLEPGEQDQIDAYTGREGLSGCAVDCGESFFHWRNDAETGLGGDVCEYTFLVRQEEAAATP